MENEKWGKKEKEEEEAGKGFWGVEHHDIAARSFFLKKDVGMTKCIVIEALQKRLLEGGMKRATTDGFRDSPGASPSP